MEYLLQAEVAEAVADLSRHFDYFHSGLNHQFAGERLAGCTIGRCFVRHAAVLALLIPTKPTHRNILGGEILHAAQQHVVFGNPELSSKNFDGHKFIEGPIKRARVGHERSSL